MRLVQCRWRRPPRRNRALRPRDCLVNGKMTGGLAVLAYPAEYRDSGIMTFLVGTAGVVYQKDLGEDTATLSQALTEYNPGDGWTPAA